MIEAKWLFENHLKHLALEHYLNAELERFNDLNESEAEDILSQSLNRPISGFPATKSYFGSTTERIALQLQENQCGQSKEMIHMYKTALSNCRTCIELFNAILLSLPDREAWLMKQIYIQQYSLSMILQLPDNPFGFCARSTLSRYRNRILNKANLFLHSYAPKGVDICLLERFDNELKP